MILARYQIHRQMLNYLQYILLQPSDSILSRVFFAPQNSPVKGDWVSNVTKLLTEYNMDMTFFEVRNKSVNSLTYEGHILTSYTGRI